MESYQHLEREFAEWNGLDPAGMVACSSGTAALHLALEAFRLPPESEVIVPDYTMVACARAVTLAGLKPVFVDCDDKLLIDPLAAQQRLRMSTRAIILVHVYGRQVTGWPPVPNALGSFWQVEDLAEAHGMPPREDSDAACWSFYRNKIVAGEEGGAVWFKDVEHAALARQLRSLGFTDAHDYTHVPRGHNYRLANCLADRVRFNLRGARESIKVRHVIEKWYDHYCPLPFQQPPRDAVWVYDFRVKEMSAKTQVDVVRELQRAGIAARFGFKPMTMQEEYHDPSRVGSESWNAAWQTVYLPVVPFVTTEADCERAFAVVRTVLGAAR